MTEPGLSDIYDLFYPSPPTLKDLASIEVAVDLWRRKIIEHRINNTLDDLDLNSNLPLSTLIPNTSTVYLTNVEKFSVRVGPSIKSWLKYHIKKNLFDFEILKNFAEFVFDFDGKIHYRRTARRMMLCDGISDDVKFKIACKNCFEDEILKIWPSVGSRMSMKEMYTSKYPERCYWICRLKNQLDVIPIPGLSGYGGGVDEMLAEKASGYWPSLEYFLNRLNSDTRSKQIMNLIESGSRPLTFFCEREEVDLTSFCRYLLTKLNETELQNLMATKGVCHALIFHSLRDFSLQKFEVEHVLRTWSYIKNVTPANEFITLVYAILADHNRNYFELKNDYPSLCKIWTSAPDHLKQAVISSISSDTSFLEISYDGDSEYFGGFVSFLLAVLSDASIEERKEFWNENWRLLMCNKQIEDLQRLANLCFTDQAEFEQFKVNQMSKYENIKQYCYALVEEGQIEALDEVLRFCSSGDEETLKDLKLKVLEQDFDFGVAYIKKGIVFNQFIDDAYTPHVRHAFHLKKHILNESQHYMDWFLERGEFKTIMQFVDAFAMYPQRARRFKGACIVDKFRSVLENKTFRKMSSSAGDDLPQFMSWLFGSDDKIEQFKNSLSIDTIVKNQIENQSCPYDKFRRDDLGRRIRQSKTKYDYFFIKFLEWYFVTDEALEEFKAKYADNDLFVELITM